MIPSPKVKMPWVVNPMYDGGEMPPFLVGDRAIIAVPLKNGGWDYEVITATETGWDDPDGDSWGSWSWDDVSHYVPLDGERLPTECC